MTSYDPYVEVVQALQLYFDGLYSGDVNKLKRIFNPACTLYSAPEEKLGSIPMEKYISSVGSRPSPESQSQIRYDKILSVTVTHEGAATAVLRTARLPRIYTEFITLLKIEGTWQIISKVYSWVLSEEKATKN